MSQEYKVQSILDERYDNITKSSDYLVKWKDYSLIYCTWQPLENLNQCYDLLQEFHTKYGHLKTTSAGKIGIPTRKQVDKQIKKYEEDNQMINCQKQTIRHKNRKALKNMKLELKQKIKSKKICKPAKNSKHKQNQENQSQQSQIPSVYYEPQIDQPSQLLFPSEPNQQLNSSHQLNNHQQIDQMPQLVNQNNQITERKIIIQSKQSKFSKSREFLAKQQKMQKQRQEKGLNCIDIQQDIQQPKQKQVVCEQKQQQQQINLEIIGIRKVNQSYIFLVRKDGRKMWMERNELIDKHTKKLCQFYESRIELL